MFHRQLGELSRGSRAADFREAAGIDVVGEIDHGRLWGHAECRGDELGGHDVNEGDQAGYCASAVVSGRSVPGRG